MSNVNSGSFGKGLEKLFGKWDPRKRGSEFSSGEIDLSDLPSLPPASPRLSSQGSLVLDREIRLLALLCVSVALMCLNWATMDSRSDHNWSRISSDTQSQAK